MHVLRPTAPEPLNQTLGVSPATHILTARTVILMELKPENHRRRGPSNSLLIPEK